jgi:(1->4)-alpha-D-glucan 1-alpha-D-glucosylmutase
MKNAALADARDSVSRSRPSVNRIPRATYRFQLRNGFGFDQIRELLPYIDSLGISDLYLSPLFQSREDSVHGYDVVDHSRIEPSFGDEDAFRRLAIGARERGMGILLDLVPNHMGINDPANQLWNDVLENGPASRSAVCFDIDWKPANGGVVNQILLPFLGKSFGETLEAGELTIVYENDRFSLAYFERRFPIALTTWPTILEVAFEMLPEDVLSKDPVELRSIITQLRNLSSADPVDEAATEERYREQEVARRRLTSLCDESAHVKEAISLALQHVNGGSDDAHRWDTLEEIISRQHYRLAFWRVAADEINYRRFFDINDLAAIRVENEEVFRSVHDLTFRMLSEGMVTGVRIDHPDGLLDPKDYFCNLQATYQRNQTRDRESHDPAERGATGLPLYVVVEKILSGEEILRSDWPVSGTTGYEFLNELSGLLVQPDGVRRLQERYESMTHIEERPRDIIYQGKLTILQDSMSSELAMVASQLYKLAKASRSTRDFTLPALQRALREVVACFPVYRTYVQSYGWDVTAEDHRRVMEAIRWAKRRNRTMAWSMLDYIAAVLLLEFPSNLADDLKPLWRKFATRFQQVTGPVTAKGVEDTSFYRYFPLASLNEVGAELGSTGISCDSFHVKMQARVADWPHALSATGTHDTKRGEDIRARLHVLSEMPDQWAEQVEKLHELTAPLLQEIDGEAAPTKNERYLFYQTLVGTWPSQPSDGTEWEQYKERLAAYFKKALREAKQHTSWLNPSESYENAIDWFLNEVLRTPDSEMLGPVASIAEQIAGPGFVNSIIQVVLKATLPGVPDFYQGSEFWDFRLVDPDNRRPVDYEHRVTGLAELKNAFGRDSDLLLGELHSSWDDRLKLFVTWRALKTRQSQASLFENSDYQSIAFEGPLASHLFGFVRQWESDWLCVIVPRWPKTLAARLGLDDAATMPPRAFCGELWRDTYAVLPANVPNDWYEHISGTEHSILDDRLDIASLFSKQFTAVLVSKNLEGTAL